MLILLTNDDGIYAPGLAALEREMSLLGEVVVVAPTTEQSGVGHSITYLTPLIVKEVFRNEGGLEGERRCGWAVEGSPADCVKIGILQFCPRQPDLVVSGINGGLNAGINVLYSGTVAAAIEGAFFGVTSVAVSLEYDEHARFDKAARLAREIVRRILDQKGAEPQLYNLNIPTAALSGTPEVLRRPHARDPLRRHVREAARPLGARLLLAQGWPRAAGGRTRNRSLRPGPRKGDDYAVGLQHDAPIGACEYAALAISAGRQHLAGRRRRVASAAADHANSSRQTEGGEA